MSKTVCILYGFSEGKWHGRHLRQALEAAGYTIVNQKNADLVIAHSGGCYALSTEQSGQRVLLINPPYWPEKSLIARFTQKFITDFRQSLGRNNIIGWLSKCTFNAAYILIHLPTNITIVRQTKHCDIRTLLADRAAVIIRNSEDTWLTPNINKVILNSPSLKVINLPGTHDDCWDNPKPYVDVINAQFTS